MAATYVELEDLDRVFDEDSCPTLKQINNYLKRVNRALSDYLGSETITDTNGGIKEAGIDLMEILIHNRQVKDGVEGKQYERIFGISPIIEDKILKGQMGLYSSFTHTPS